jgi:uncharacterized coiled-coil protein SlyX
MRLKTVYSLLVLGLCLIASGRAVAAPTVREMILESCKYYQGQSLGDLIMPESPGQLNNPLSASPLGRKLFSKISKNAYSEYSYLGADASITAIMESAEYQPALDQCYGNDEMAKVNFTFLLRKIEVDAKSMGGYGEALNWTVMGGLFAKLTQSKWFLSRPALVKSAFKWVQRVSLTVTVLSTGYVAVRLIQHARGKVEKAKLELDPIFTEKALHELNETLEMAKGAMADLESQYQLLIAQIEKESDPARKQKLEALAKETKQLITELNQQLKAS